MSNSKKTIGATQWYIFKFLIWSSLPHATSWYQYYVFSWGLQSKKQVLHMSAPHWKPILLDIGNVGIASDSRSRQRVPQLCKILFSKPAQLYSLSVSQILITYQLSLSIYHNITSYVFICHIILARNNDKKQTTCRQNYRVSFDAVKSQRPHRANHPCSTHRYKPRKRHAPLDGGTSQSWSHQKTLEVGLSGAMSYTKTIENKYNLK